MLTATGQPHSERKTQNNACKNSNRKREASWTHRAWVDFEQRRETIKQPNTCASIRGKGVPCLDSEDVFRRVPPEECPLAAVPLEQVVRERHLAARDVGPLILHDSPVSM